jgi:archaemetzincin
VRRKIVFLFIPLLTLALFNLLGRGEKVKKIYLIPVGSVDSSMLEFLKEKLEEKFHIPCKIADAMKHPTFAFTPERAQYNSSLILDKLRAHFPKDAMKVLGITSVDLYVPRLNFVFGEAELNGGVAVISTARLKQEFYGLEGDKRLFERRCIKEAVHELGHTFGLSHCRDRKCVMFFSNSLIDTDRKGDDFCKMCLHQVKENLDVDKKFLRK